METNFNFKSQPATSREQSERLLALGLKKETADMHWTLHSVTQTWYVVAHPEDGVGKCIHAWSLHRLIEMMPQYLYIPRDKEEFHLDINNDGVMYDGVAMKLALVEFVECGNLYDNIIGCIAYLIKEGYFNKEYLV